MGPYKLPVTLMKSFRNPARVFFIVLMLASPVLAAPASQDARKALGARALDVLRSALSHDDADVRALAAEQWGRIGNPAAVPLLEKALKDRNPYVRIAAAKSLHALGDATGARALEEIASIVPKPAKTDDALAAVEAMKTVARNKVRVEALRALAAMARPSSLPVLEKVRWDADGAVRDACTLALARLGAGGVGEFYAALQDEDPEVRAKAVRSLGESGLPAVLARLKPLAEDKEFVVRAAVMDALGASRSPDALPVLQGGLEDQNELVRAKAVEALGEIPDAGSVPLLESARKSANAHIELLALRGLARRGRPVDAALAERALGRPDPDTQLLAVETLEWAGGERAAGALESALDDRDAKVRVRAAAALVTLLRKPSPKGGAR